MRVVQLATKVRAHRAPNLLGGYVGRSHVDHTEARKATVRRFGRSHRSRLRPGDGITLEERGGRVRDAAQFGPGAGPGPGRGFRARYNVRLAVLLLPSGGT